MSTQELLTLSAEQVGRAVSALPPLPSLPAIGGTAIVYVLMGLPLAYVAVSSLWRSWRYDIAQCWRLAGARWALACAMSSLVQLATVGLCAVAAGSLVKVVAPATTGWWDQPALVAQAVQLLLFTTGSPVSWLLAGPFAMLVLAMWGQVLSTSLHYLSMTRARQVLKAREAALLTQIEAQQDASAKNGRNTLRYW